MWSNHIAVIKCFAQPRKRQGETHALWRLFHYSFYWCLVSGFILETVYWNGPLTLVLLGSGWSVVYYLKSNQHQMRAYCFRRRDVHPTISDFLFQICFSWWNPINMQFPCPRRKKSTGHILGPNWRVHQPLLIPVGLPYLFVLPNPSMMNCGRPADTPSALHRSVIALHLQLQKIIAVNQAISLPIANKKTC